MAIAFEMELEIFGKSKSLSNIYHQTLKSKRDYLIESLRKIGFNPVVSDGSMFVVAEWSAFGNYFIN